MEWRSRLQFQWHPRQVQSLKHSDSHPRPMEQRVLKHSDSHPRPPTLATMAPSTSPSMIPSKAPSKMPINMPTASTCEPNSIQLGRSNCEGMQECCMDAMAMCEQLGTSSIFKCCHPRGMGLPCTNDNDCCGQQTNQACQGPQGSRVCVATMGPTMPPTNITLSPSLGPSVRPT